MYKFPIIEVSNLVYADDNRGGKIFLDHATVICSSTFSCKVQAETEVHYQSIY